MTSISNILAVAAQAILLNDDLSRQALADICEGEGHLDVATALREKGVPPRPTFTVVVEGVKRCVRWDGPTQTTVYEPVPPCTVDVEVFFGDIKEDVKRHARWAAASRKRTSSAGPLLATRRKRREDPVYKAWRASQDADNKAGVSHEGESE